MNVTGAKHICLVTVEFHGLFKNGGIGTANTSLALALAKEGHQVTVAFANVDINGPRVKEGDFSDLQKYYATLGITLDFTPVDETAVGGFGDPRSASYSVYRYLRRNRFDIVFFNDNGAHAYYALLAKRTGRFPNAPAMYVVTHGPLEWAHDLNAIAYSEKSWILLNYMERRCVEMADTVVSPSQYLIEWMVARGWKMPRDTRMTQNIVRVANPVTAAERIWHKGIKEIVFFGRLEVRKGVELFCDAIDLLEKSRDLKDIQVTFLGKFQKIAGLHSGIYILERSRTWKSFVRFIVNFDQEQALEYLGRGDTLPVIPSIAENSPCVVSECLQMGLPFLATGTGGTPELLEPEDRGQCLFDPKPASLMAKLERALQFGQQSAHMAVPLADTEAAWFELVASSPASPPDDGAVAGTPRNSAVVEKPIISVCLVLSEQSSATQACVESILSQDCPGVEILFAGPDNANTNLGGTEGTGVQVSFRRIALEEPLDYAAARNAVASHAAGEFLVFLNERETTLASGCLRALSAAAHYSRADVLTAIPMQHMGGEQKQSLPYFPLGACLEMGAIENCFGEGLILVRRRRFAETTGFEVTGDREFEDWLFMAKAALGGLRVEVLPEPLFWRAPPQDSELNRPDRVAQHRRVLEAYKQQPFSKFANFFEMLLDIDRKNKIRIPKIVAFFGAAAADIALALSNAAAPDDPRLRRKFFQYCLERNRICEALDFALVNEPALLPNAANNAGATLQTASRLRFSEVSLTEPIRDRLVPAHVGKQPGLNDPAGGIVSHSLSAQTLILKAIGICAPGTRSLNVKYTVHSDEDASVAIALCRPEDRLKIAADGSMSGEPVAWSGWISADGSGTMCEIALRIREQITAPLDLFLLSRSGPSGTGGNGLVTWQSAEGRVLINEAFLPSVPEIGTGAALLSDAVRESGIQLTETDDLASPYPSFRPGKEMLLRPIAGKTNLVRLPSALSPRARGVRCVFSVANEKAHDVEFGIWLRASSDPAANESELQNGGMFSGWINVREKHKKHEAAVMLSQQVDASHDLYLATRVLNKANTGLCRALWHEIFVIDK